MANENDHWEIPAQRLAMIGEIIRSRGAVSVPELADMLSTSEATIRRDLRKLSEDGLINRSHGGAVSIGFTTHEPLFTERRVHNQEEKMRIGQYSLRFIKPGQSVIFDSSSTVLAVVEELRKQPVPITAITNDVQIAASLSEIPGIEVVVTGGEIRPGSFTLWGTHAQNLLKSIHADLAIMGIHAITGIHLSDTNLRVAAMKRAIIIAAYRVVLLADSSKFGPSAFIEVPDLTYIQDLVTDTSAPKTALEAIARDSKQTSIHLV
jgi:DeoR family transcriptional regulator of aga operon